MAEVKESISTSANAIRRAWKAGKRTVTIDGVELKIKRVDRTVQFTTGAQYGKMDTGTHHKRKESWLVASPMDKRKVVPLYNVEYEPGKNFRSAMARQDK
jgi:hypothetical protein